MVGYSGDESVTLLPVSQNSGSVALLQPSSQQLRQVIGQSARNDTALALMSLGFLQAAICGGVMDPQTMASLSPLRQACPVTKLVYKRANSTTGVNMVVCNTQQKHCGRLCEVTNVSLLLCWCAGGSVLMTTTQ